MWQAEARQRVKNRNAANIVYKKNKSIYKEIYLKVEFFFIQIFW